jgi:hypothetical protein
MKNCHQVDGNQAMLFAGAGHGEHFPGVVFALSLRLALDLEILLRSEMGFRQCRHIQNFNLPRGRVFSADEVLERLPSANGAPLIAGHENFGRLGTGIVVGREYKSIGAGRGYRE